MTYFSEKTFTEPKKNVKYLLSHRLGSNTKTLLEYSVCMSPENKKCFNYFRQFIGGEKILAAV